MAALGLDVYGSDEEDDADVTGSGDGVVLVGAYAAAAATDVAFEVHPAADAMGSAAGLQAMQVDTAPGASPPGASDGVAPPGTPGDSNVEPSEAHGLPLELLRQPPGECAPAVKAKVEKFLHVKRTQKREIKTELRQSRPYRNPSFLQKMVEHSKIKEFGSNLPKEVFDPDNLHEEDFFEALKAAWDKEQDRRAAERAATGRIDFTGGSKHAAGSQARAASSLSKPVSGDVAAVVQKARMQAAAAAAAKAKASRWDHSK